MLWTQSTKTSLAALTIGTVCWVYSQDTTRCQTAVRAEDGWRCHGQDHFYVSGVSKFIVLPTK
jgi:hypothetical protein